MDWYYYKYPVVIFAYKNKKVKVNLTPKIKIEKVKNGYEIKNSQQTDQNPD